MTKYQFLTLARNMGVLVAINQAAELGVDYYTIGTWRYEFNIMQKEYQCPLIKQMEIG